jgi:hypothetical protein
MHKPRSQKAKMQACYRVWTDPAWRRVPFVLFFPLLFCFFLVDCALRSSICTLQPYLQQACPAHSTVSLWVCEQRIMARGFSCEISSSIVQMAHSLLASTKSARHYPKLVFVSYELLLLPCNSRQIFTFRVSGMPTSMHIRDQSFQ